MLVCEKGFGRDISPFADHLCMASSYISISVIVHLCLRQFRLSLSESGGVQYEQCVAEAMQFLGLVQCKAADCHRSQDALHLLKELESFQAELLPSQQTRLDEIRTLASNRGLCSFHC